MKYKAYTQYKQSNIDWVSEIPKSWEILPAFSVVKNTCIKNVDGAEDNVLSLSYGNIVKRNLDDNFGLLPESFNTYQIVSEGNIILRLTDLQNDKKSLRVGYVTQKGIITSAYLKLACSKRINPKYAYFLLHSYDLTKVFYGMGGGLRQSMKFDDLKRLPMIIPSYSEQLSIVRFLDAEAEKIDQLIDKQIKLISLLKEKKQAMISHVATKGLHPDVKMKYSGIEWLGNVPEHWVVRRLKHTATLQSGIPKGKDLTGKKTISVPMLRVANVQDGYLNLDDIHMIDIEPHELSRYALKKGDVLMNEGGDNDQLGRGAVWNDEIHPCIHQNHVFSIRTIDIEPTWLDLLTRASYAKFYFYSVAKQSTNLASVSSSNIKETPLLIPPKKERSYILDYIFDKVKKFELLTLRAERQILLLKERRSALISAAVTGKIDVRHWQPDAKDVA
ncbi:restriction endonuclease subunit S [Raoultella ornithinolytica]|uniref:restriction endonuclease subunit S n=1 Tax=Raoultella ornithinolytica TaxID=54291 RepID=UPI0028634D0D|nr:restriction endonuclease subunit S [Raoultella ornithinolytica]HDV8372055.1 restriction endonuclease subunit S [Raoultella ornithinolytica]